MFLCRPFHCSSISKQFVNCKTFVRQTVCYSNLTALPEEQQVTVEVGSDVLVFGSGRLGRFADGAATVRLGNTNIFCAAVCKNKPNASFSGFTPLTVDYRSKSAAAGRIPTNFLKRELGPSDSEILTARMVDRSIRPFFPYGFNCDTQIVHNVLSVDGVHDADVLSINAASAALAVSDIPWNGPTAAVRISLLDDNMVVNPTRLQMNQSSLNLVMTGYGLESRPKKLVMLDMSGNDADLARVMQAIKLGLNEIAKINSGIEKLRKLVGKEKRSVELQVPREELIEKCHMLLSTRLRTIFSDATHDKISRDVAVRQLVTEITPQINERFSDLAPGEVESALSNVVREIFRQITLTTGIRCDGRTRHQVRPIDCKVDVYPSLHGSGLFQRGQTQVLATVTFDSPEAAFRGDPVSALTGAVKEKRFMLHYEFPGFATNELSTGARKNRRELGHGALAEKGLIPLVPKDFPFTIRLTAEVFESNGSSSMASVCAGQRAEQGSMALMDAGVPLPMPVAGVAMGMVSTGLNCIGDSGADVADYSILTDISGIEDYMGDMDFKIAGTHRGFTAIQLDLKLPGIPVGIVLEALEQSVDARKAILGCMNDCIEQERDTLKEDGPQIEKLTLAPHNRAKLFGQGGFNIKRVQAQTGIQVTSDDDSTMTIFAPCKDAMQEAKVSIDKIIEQGSESQLEFGAIFSAKIVEIRSNGVMVTLYPGMSPTLLPNSQLDSRRISHPSALDLSVADEIMVKYFGRDPKTGQMRVSRKILQKTGAPASKQPTAENRHSPWTTDNKQIHKQHQQHNAKEQAN